tara:strand:- start:1319 stop:1837 length:519 start_codon:yes stop_codon:yes gene_type:complete
MSISLFIRKTFNIIDINKNVEEKPIYCDRTDMKLYNRYYQLYTRRYRHIKHIQINPNYYIDKYNKYIERLTKNSGSVKFNCIIDWTNKLEVKKYQKEKPKKRVYVKKTDRTDNMLNKVINWNDREETSNYKKQYYKLTNHYELNKEKIKIQNKLSYEIKRQMVMWVRYINSL